MKSLVIIEHNNSELKILSLNTIKAARLISEEVDALVIGYNHDKVVKEVSKADGLNKVFFINDEFFKCNIAENMCKFIEPFLKNNNYSHILAPSSTFGKNLMPKIAAKMDVQQISDITNVIEPDVFERPIYAGNAIAKVKSNDTLKVITVRATCFEAVQLNSNVEATEINMELNRDSAVQFVGYEFSKSDRPELTAAKIIISGGRGMQNGDNFKLLEGIADKLGAAMGASRAAVDAGFVPNDWQVGQTGKIVAPDLYIAVGISGAIQHMAGIKDSKFIASINKDEEAPIFKFSDYGLVADLFEALPKLEQKL
tara:strand:+ start:723 stop:1658 length:936 start_codon:yes stop_codon:yes gene_type:complete